MTIPDRAPLERAPLERAALERDVRMAARAMARAGLVHAYGHCSARLDADNFIVCPPRPMGLVAPGEPCDLVSISQGLPTTILGEVRIHQQIYRRRAEVGGVVRFMSPRMMALAALGRTPRARHGFGCYFAPSPPLWSDPQLVRDEASAEGVARTMGASAAVMMRGNGAVTAGDTIRDAVVLAFYLEDACRVELEALAAGLADDAPVIEGAEASRRATKAGRIFERMWDFLAADDPELQG